MKNYYQILSQKIVGDQLSISTLNSLYEFTKIGDYRYLVEKHVLCFDGESFTLSGTFTTMVASAMYEMILKEQYSEL